jgi:nicotinic acid mononucleotide adenylyltransferase
MEKHTVVAFGRMNPPTVGHQALVNAVQEHAKKVGGTAEVHLSKSEDPKKNPLSYKDKVKYAQHAFGNVVKDSSAKNPLEVLKSLHGKTDHVTMVAGDDRVEEYKKLLNRYNGHPDHYTFKSINVVSAGARDPDSEGVEGMSASKMREHAKNKSHEQFSSGLPDTLKQHSHEIMSKVRSGMGINEQFSKIIKRVIRENNLSEGRFSSSSTSHKRSLISGLTRRINFAKQWAASLQPTEKSPGLKPRNERSQYGAKHNASLQFKKDENKVKKEEVSLEESFNDFKIAKSAGYGTFLTSKDMGINIQGAFAHHPSVEEQIDELEKKKQKQINRFNYENVSIAKATNKQILSE